MIEVAGVCKDYHSRSTQILRRVLNDISFTVNPGDKVAVLGHNGAGKSTLIRLLGGMEQPLHPGPGAAGKVHGSVRSDWVSTGMISGL